VIVAEPDAVWQLVSDPYHLPRWWPRVTRVEDVHERRRGSGSQWTMVLETKSGKDVRADYRCLYSREGSGYAWEQEIENTPFAKVLKSSVTRFELNPADGGTRVTIEQEQGLRGMSRLGGFMLRRATSEQLDGALDGLERLLAAGPETQLEPETEGADEHEA
jgi:uncharacterized protein YndB with AHSA1/START domain